MTGVQTCALPILKPIMVGSIGTYCSVTSGETNMTITFSAPVTMDANSGTEFTVNMSGGPCTLTYASGNGDKWITYTMSRSITSGETGTVSYNNTLGDLSYNGENVLPFELTVYIK